jgi:Ca2+-transporting ATPase
MAFTTFVMFQVFNVFNARDETRSVLRRALLHNWRLWLALVAIVALQGVVVHWPPAQSLCRTGPLSGTDWLVAIGVGSSILVVEELRKLTLALFRHVRSV